jgi:hypothetical protein
MPSLWFIVPAHGRLPLARICLTQLRRTCDALEQEGTRASAVVIACDENLDTARDMGFATVERDNRFTSRRFNDGIQLACDKRFNPFPVDYVVPLGSDDWVDWRLFHNLPAPNTMVGFQRMSFVKEDGTELTVRHIRSEGGCGIRIWTRQAMAAVGYRPADEHRTRGCDTSMLINVKAFFDLRIEHRDLDPLQIVDWKSHGENLNPYDTLARHKQELKRDPFAVLQGRYPAEALTAMQEHYYGALVPA